HQHFLTVPGAPHGAIGGEPWSKPSAPCSVQIATAFVNAPTATIDEACLADVAPIAFEPDGATSSAFFATPDPWAAAVGPWPPPPPAAVAAKRAAIREDLARRRRVQGWPARRLW